LWTNRQEIECNQITTPESRQHKCRYFRISLYTLTAEITHLLQQAHNSQCIKKGVQTSSTVIYIRRTCWGQPT
jgi:hypothetical protein